MKCTCVVLSSVACPVIQYFPHDLTNGTIFKKKKIYIYIREEGRLRVFENRMLKSVFGP